MRKMNASRNVLTVLNMVTGGLLVAGLFVLMNGTSKIAHADPGELFVSPDGAGTVCTQATPCALQTALDIAETNGEDDIIYLTAGSYEGNFAYTPQDGGSFVMMGEPGTTAQDIVLDGQGTGTVLYLSCSSEGGSVSVEGLTIQNGSESGLRVSCGNGSLDVFLDHVVIQNNTTDYMGGGIYLRTTENAAVTMGIWNSVIRYNQSPGDAAGRYGRSGGIHAHSYAGNSAIALFVVNSLIYKNQARATGGGIGVSASEVGDNNVTRATMINTTISSNVSNMHNLSDIQGEGGGIRTYAYGGNGSTVSLDLYNTIVYGNTALSGKAGQDLYVGESDPGNATVNAYYSDIGDVGGNPDHYNPVNVINAAPFFAAPADDDYHLSYGSPCIDAGTTAVPDPPGLPTIDFEGDSRVIGAAPDIGADEYRYMHHIYMPLVMKNYP